ncbi:RNA polymerase sigma factor [Vulgatibacter sp.]|uniref:RNA polymerase sigma factor n=1 Tax=Vulgatibacter sp. TaxID=1971226 RepID=UPI003561595C
MRNAIAIVDHAAPGPEGEARKGLERKGLQVLQGGADHHDDLAALYHRYGGQVLGRCRYLLGDAEAEDAAQEVFARALLHLEGFRSEASPLTWLLKIATHHCLNVLRANRALWRDEVKKLALVRSEADDGGDQRALVRSLLARFDLETQACAVHYLVDEMSQDEVAQVVGLSVPTVRKRVRTFLAAARAELGLPAEETP